MTETLSITYLKCQSCTAKIHCEACGEELAASLSKKQGIYSVLANIPDKSIRVEHDLDIDALEDLLDEQGALLG